MTLFTLVGYGFACAALYYLVPMRVRWLVLLAVSYGFYAMRGPAGLPFMIVTTMTTWLGALMIGRIGEKMSARIKAAATLTREEKKAIRARAKGRQKAAMLAVLLINFGLLALLKYTDDVRGWFGASPLGLVLPLGISFYTFQSMGYLLDVYGGKVKPERNPLKFALFVSFFPQLIQGPIGRYDQLAPQLTTPHRLSATRMQRSVQLILWGLFQKMVIADRAFPLVNTVFSAQAGEYGGAVTVLAVLMYSLQQYCDFAGGIDMVTGIALQFGIELAPNFKRPYFAVSLADFWRRWHISLGAWMRDYVFYPFALSKPMTGLTKAIKPRLGNDIARAIPAALGNVLVFLLVGLWHGATSNYIVWGLYNGVILAISALLEPIYKKMNARLPKLTASGAFHLFRVLRTFLIVNIGWFFDRCAYAGDAVRMMGTVLTDPRTEQLAADFVFNLGISQLDFTVLAIAAALLFAVSLVRERGADVGAWLTRRCVVVRFAVLLIGVAVVVLAGVWGSGFDEATFIYYQF